MDFKLINYKIFKIKNLLKHTKLLFIFHSTRLKSENWLPVEQALKLKDFSYYKIYNVTANIIIKNSIFKNANKLLINTMTLFCTLNNNFFLIPKLININPLLTFLFIKINNKLYSNSQIQKINFSTYQKNILTFCYLLEKTLKKSLIFIKTIN